MPSIRVVWSTINHRYFMTATTQEATEAIYLHTYGMDTGSWELATRHFADEVEVDYSQVGAPKGRMTKAELQEFLHQLLDKPGLKVHTAISQVLENPSTPQEYIAYYSVKHFKSDIGQADTFFVYGWYSFRMQEGR